MCGHLAIELINGLEVTSQENLGSNSWRKFKRCVYDSIWLYCNIAIQFRNIGLRDVHKQDAQLRVALS